MTIRENIINSERQEILSDSLEFLFAKTFGNAFDHVPGTVLTAPQISERYSREEIGSAASLLLLKRGM